MPLSFIDNPLYLKYYCSTKCGALIVAEDFKDFNREEVSLIKVKNPRLSLLKAIQFIHQMVSLVNDTSFKYKSLLFTMMQVLDLIHIESFNTIQSGVEVNNVRLGNNCIISETVKLVIMLPCIIT